MKIESLAPSAQPDGPLVCTLETGERLKVPTFLAADFNLYAGRELSEDELSALIERLLQTTVSGALPSIASRSYPNADWRYHIGLAWEGSAV